MAVGSGAPVAALAAAPARAGRRSAVAADAAVAAVEGKAGAGDAISAGTTRTAVTDRPAMAAVTTGAAVFSRDGGGGAGTSVATVAAAGGRGAVRPGRTVQGRVRPQPLNTPTKINELPARSRLKSPHISKGPVSAQNLASLRPHQSYRRTHGVTTGVHLRIR
ncbi:hypothetical protein [Mycobacterium tuberculosis]|uniref:hypothetical protein n=1 Tax=Mycobacterium tuberculosis TaxID=1773 RepID=UPI0039C8A522